MRCHLERSVSTGRKRSGGAHAVLDAPMLAARAAGANHGAAGSEAAPRIGAGPCPGERVLPGGEADESEKKTEWWTPSTFGPRHTRNGTGAPGAASSWLPAR